MGRPYRIFGYDEPNRCDCGSYENLHQVLPGIWKCETCIEKFQMESRKKDEAAKKPHPDPQEYLTDENTGQEE